MDINLTNEVPGIKKEAAHDLPRRRQRATGWKRKRMGLVPEPLTRLMAVAGKNGQ